MVAGNLNSLHELDTGVREGMLVNKGKDNDYFLSHTIQSTFSIYQKNLDPELQVVLSLSCSDTSAHLLSPIKRKVNQE